MGFIEIIKLIIQGLTDTANTATNNVESISIVENEVKPITNTVEVTKPVETVKPTKIIQTNNSNNSNKNSLEDLDEDLVKKINNVVTVFETGRLPSIEAYACVSIYPDGKDGKYQLTALIQQSTSEGNLQKFVDMYAGAGGKYSEEFKKYAGKVYKNPKIHLDKYFIDLLKKSAREDIVNRDTQEEFFSDIYFEPARKWAIDNGFTLPLSLLVIFDSFIHSGSVPLWLRNKFNAKVPKNGGNEKEWIKQYITVRKEWLLNKSALLAKTVYRMNCFAKAIQEDNWYLEKPILANGVSVRAIDNPFAVKEVVTPIDYFVGEEDKFDGLVNIDFGI